MKRKPHKTPVGRVSLPMVALALTFNAQLPTVLAGPAVTSIAAGSVHSLFSKSDGSLWVMGDNYEGQLGIGFTPAKTNLPVQVLSSGVQKVAAGAVATHSFFLSGGSLWVMGHNDYGQLGDGTTNDHLFPEQLLAYVHESRDLQLPLHLVVPRLVRHDGKGDRADCSQQHPSFHRHH